MEQCTVCERERETEKQHERHRETEKIKLTETENRSTDQTTCSCAWNWIHHYFRSNKMHAQVVRVLPHGQPKDWLHRRGHQHWQDFLSTLCSVLDYGPFKHCFTSSQSTVHSKITTTDLCDIPCWWQCLRYYSTTLTASDASCTVELGVIAGLKQNQT